MRHHGKPQLESKGKLLAFPPPAGSGASLPVRSARARDAADVGRRMQLVEQWGGRVWLLLGWMLAVGRLKLAVAQREVFGAEATLAFLIAVVMPIMRVRKFAGWLGAAAQALRRAIRART